jgi:hypothetical protein
LARDYSTASLITDVTLIAGIPVLQELFAASELLRFADMVLVNKIVPLILEHRKGHFLAYTDTTTTTATRYDIDRDAMDMGLKNVTFVDANGFEMPGLPVDFDAEIEGNAGLIRDGMVVRGRRYYVRQDQIILYPNATAGETLRQHFNRLPGKLCRSAAYTYNDGSEAAEAVQVVSVNTGTGAITCTASSVPSTITTSTPVCVVKGIPGFRQKIVRATPTNVTSTIVTLGSDIATVAAADIVAGDWLCLAGETPVIPLPVEGHAVVAQAVACKVLESLGDTEGLVNAKEDMKDIWETYRKTFNQRIEEGPRKVYGGDMIGDWS